MSSYEEQVVHEKFKNKLEQRTFFDDRKNINTFIRHAISKVDVRIL